MVWPWTSSSTAQPPAASSSSTSPQSLSTPAEKPPRAEAAKQQETPSTAPDSDSAEVRKLLDFIRNDIDWDSEPAATPATAAPSMKSKSTTPPPTTSTTTLADSLYPTTMSCRQALDLATGCQSMAGQLRHVYRYGEMRSCSAHWSDLWFCMRLKGKPGPVSENLVREHYREKERLKYYAEDKRSSEDVWRAREQRIPEDVFFREPLGRPTDSDEEWRRKEIERRRKIREDFGYDDD